MKNICVILAIFIVGCAGSLELLPVEERELVIVQEAPGITKEDIYNKTIKWTATHFADSKDVLEVQDKEKGLIIGKGIVDFNLGMGVISPCRFTMTVETKEERYRIKFEGLTWIASDGDPIPLNTTGYRTFAKDVFESLRLLAAELHNYIMDTGDSDW